MKMKWLYILILLIPVCTCGWMNTMFMGGGTPPAGGGTPVALDADSSHASDSGTSQTWSHTCTGSNRAMVVYWVSADDTNDVTGATYNSVAMTEEADVDPGDNTIRLWMFTLINPASGANNIVISFTSSGHNEALGLARSFTEVHQTTAFGTVVTGSDIETNDTDPSISVAGTVNGVVVDAASGRMGTPTLAIGANQTDELTQSDSFTIGSTSLEAGTGTKTMSWTLGTQSAWAQAGIVINPASP